MRKIDPAGLTRRSGYQICANLCSDDKESVKCDIGKGEDGSGGEGGNKNPFAELPKEPSARAKVSAASDDAKTEPSSEVVPGLSWIIVVGTIFVCVIFVTVMVIRKKKRTRSTEKTSAVELSSSVWQSHAEPQTGRTYYHNTMTGETSWQAPVEVPYVVTTR